MTPQDTEVLLSCMETADRTVRRQLGFSDEDFTQDMREDMLRAALSYNPDMGTSLRTWIYTKTKYSAVNARRRRDGRVFPGVRKCHLYSLEWAAENGDRSSEPVSEDPEYERSEDLVDVHEKVLEVTPLIASVVGKLSPRKQEMIARRLSGENLHEIAESFGVTESCVSLTFTNFKNKLADKMHRSGTHR